MFPLHRLLDPRLCGAITQGMGLNTSVFANGILAAVMGDPDTHGGGGAADALSAAAGLSGLNNLSGLSMLGQMTGIGNLSALGNLNGLQGLSSLTNLSGFGGFNNILQNVGTNIPGLMTSMSGIGMSMSSIGDVGGITSTLSSISGVSSSSLISSGFSGLSSMSGLSGIANIGNLGNYMNMAQGITGLGGSLSSMSNAMNVGASAITGALGGSSGLPGALLSLSNSNVFIQGIPAIAAIKDMGQTDIMGIIPHITGLPIPIMGSLNVMLGQGNIMTGIGMMQQLGLGNFGGLQIGELVSIGQQVMGQVMSFTQLGGGSASAQIGNIPSSAPALGSGTTVTGQTSGYSFTFANYIDSRVSSYEISLPAVNIITNALVQDDGQYIVIDDYFNLYPTQNLTLSVVTA